MWVYPQAGDRYALKSPALERGRRWWAGRVEGHNSIGEVLGAHLALFENDLTGDPDNLEIIEKIRSISEAYRNFTSGGLASFSEDFEHGYQRGKRDVHTSLEAEPKTGLDPRRDFGDN